MVEEIKYRGKSLVRTSKKQKSILCALAVSAILSQSSSITYAAEVEEFGFDQVVVTATRTPEKISNIASDVTVVTAEQLEQKGARTLADALEGVAGVRVERSGTGQLAIPYILGSDRVIVMIDGQRINRPQGLSAGSGGVDLSTVLVGDHIEKIEIVRGGGSALYGADAVGGVINIITKKGTGGAKTLIDTGFGTNNTHKYLISHQGSAKDYHWFITGMKEDTNGERPNSAYDAKNLTLRLDKDINSTDTLTFNYEHFSDHAGYPGNLVFGPTPNDYGNVLRNNWGINYSQKHDSGVRMFKYYQNNENYTGDSSGIIDYQSTVNAFEYQDTHKWNDKNTLTWGNEWRREKSTGQSYSPQPADRTVHAIYLQNQYKISDRTEITTGLRYDDNSQYGKNWLPKLGIVHHADVDTNYFANWGKVFRSPNMCELYGPWNSGNPNLKPEMGWTAELGMKKRMNDRNEVTLSVFKQHLTDAIKFDMDTYQFQNLDTYTATGTNISLATKWSENFTTDIGYSYLDARKDNNQSAGQPHSTLHVGYVLKDGKLTHTLNGQYASNKWTKSTNYVASHFVWNTNFQYTLTKEQSIYLTMNNIFDQKYETVKGYPAEGRSIFFGLRQSI